MIGHWYIYLYMKINGLTFMQDSLRLLMSSIATSFIVLKIEEVFPQSINVIPILIGLKEIPCCVNHFDSLIERLVCFAREIYLLLTAVRENKEGMTPKVFNLITFNSVRLSIKYRNVGMLGKVAKFISHRGGTRL